MGMTQEYRLHHFSRRLWAWRQRVRRRAVLGAPELGGAVVAASAEILYPAITGGSAVI